VFSIEILGYSNAQGHANPFRNYLHRIRRADTLRVEAINRAQMQARELEEKTMSIVQLEADLHETRRNFENKRAQERSIRARLESEMGTRPVPLKRQGSH